VGNITETCCFAFSFRMRENSPCKGDTAAKPSGGLCEVVSKALTENEKQERREKERNAKQII
jgi:hypothetical protein